MKIRFNKGGFDESLSTQEDIENDFNKIFEFAQKGVQVIMRKEYFHICFYCHDYRNKDWKDTFIIHYHDPEQSFVIGFCNEEVKYKTRLEKNDTI